jgi:heme/copper-type cytochrome/quinol oxidase subunit 2
MRATIRIAAAVLAGVLPTACSSARFAGSLEGLDRASAPHQTVSMTAERYDFDPAELHVKAGTLVTLTITALDDVHGFRLADWDIDVRLEPDVPVTVEFYAATPGSYDFQCSHFCGLGHFGMSGTLVVEP